jgi:hypothetical protein
MLKIENRLFLSPWKHAFTVGFCFLFLLDTLYMLGK